MPLVRERRSPPATGPRRPAAGSVAVAVVVVLAVALAGPARAQTREQEDKLHRLAEVIGALHYLRELCGADDGQLWRSHMKALIDSEGRSALKRAALTRRFNLGYRNYSRTYRECSVSAKTATERFLDEAQTTTDGLLATKP